MRSVRGRHPHRRLPTPQEQLEPVTVHERRHHILSHASSPIATARNDAVDYPWGEVPRILYHGTPTSKVASIRQSGIRTGSPERANFEDYKHDTWGNIYLTDTEKAARFFGAAASMEAARKTGSKELDFTVLVIDAKTAKTLGGVSIMGTPGALDRSYGGEQYVALNRIPPEAIVGTIRVHTDPNTHKVVTERSWS